MNDSDKKRIQDEVLKIADRVNTHGRDKELVKLDLSMQLSGQQAINYKLMKLFAPEITDQQLVGLLFLLGVKGGTELLKVAAIDNEIEI